MRKRPLKSEVYSAKSQGGRVMRFSAKYVKRTLIQSIKDIGKVSWLYVKNPDKDFTRNRKLSFENMLTAILCMKGGSLTSELIDCFRLNSELPSTSAFVQQRAKILPEAFDTLFHMFNDSFPLNKTYKGYNLIAVDGSDLHIPTDENDTESYYPGTAGQKPYNLLHLNTAYDLCNCRYVDAVVQKSENENKAFVDMVDRLNVLNAILIADRNYESYNDMAHVQEKGYKFLIRIKDINSNGIAGGLVLPDTDEFDLPLHLFLTRKQTKKTKELFKNKNSYKLLNYESAFDYLPKQSNKSMDIKPYELFVRVVRFKITDNTYEVVATNLTADEFPPDELKALYAMRWGIETSYRDLKYTIGLSYYHSKKVECNIQEIFARLIMYNFTQIVISTTIIQQKNRFHSYKVNFAAAVHICRKYIRIGISPPEIEALILKYIVPIRPQRKRQRKPTAKAAISFMYRIT